MGNRISCVHLQVQHRKQQQEQQHVVKTIKVIKSDGGVTIYKKPIKVSEIMIEFPKHLICGSDSFFIGQKVPHLSEDDYLQLGHEYFIFPNQFFQSVLTFVTITSFMSSQPRTSLIKKVASSQPFHVEKTPSGCLRIRVTEEFISRLVEAGKIKEEEGGEEEEEEEEEGSSAGKMISRRICNTPQLAKDYEMLVGSKSRQGKWKPKLEMIREKKEKKEKKRVSYSKRKKKLQHHLSRVNFIKSASKVRTKIRSKKK